jgi:RNA polymerase sigma-70 factor, ECF subfamily
MYARGVKEIGQDEFARSVSPFRLILLTPCVIVAEPVNENESKDRDIALLRRVAARDRDAFGQLYDIYSSLLYSIAARMLGNSTDAEDVVQETFIQIWGKAESYDPRLGHPHAWVVTLVRNRAIDRIRSNKRRGSLATESEEHFSALAPNSESANETVSGREKALAIHSAVCELPPDQRSAIELAFFSGLTQNEISTRLQEPLGTIKARIRRGLLKLRDQLEGLQ